MRAARGDRAGDALEDEGGDRQDIDQVGQHHDAQRGRGGAAVERAEHVERQRRQHRPEDDKAERRAGLHAPRAPHTAQGRHAKMPHRARQGVAPPTS